MLKPHGAPLRISVVARSRHIIRLLALPLTATLLVPAAAVAQQSASAMAEIVVTAQRREQQLQDVPLAITAYSAEQLERLQVTDALDTAHLVPNMIGHSNTGLGSANSYTLRGLGNTESISTFDPPVGSYIDDIYITRQNANNFTFFDVDHVEVLRGPQGTLFGRNTTGGAVRIIMKKPAEEFGGYVEGGVGEYGRYNVDGTVDIPVSSTVLTKLSGYYINDNGYVDNLTTGAELNSAEDYGVRGAVRWLATDDLSFDLAVDYENSDKVNITNTKSGSDRVSHTGFSENGGALVPFFTGPKAYYGLGNEVEAFNVYLNVDWTTSAGTLSSITGWRDTNQDFAVDFLDGNAAARARFGQAPPPWGGYTISNDSDHQQFSQEFKFVGNFGDKLQYVTGVYYLNEDNRTDFGTLLDLDLSLTRPPFVPTGAFVPVVLSDLVMENSTETWAVYAQGDYKIDDHWTATLGLRYTDESKDVSFADNQPCAPTNPSCWRDANGDGISDNDLSNVNFDNLNSINPAFANVPRNQGVTELTPRLALQYTVDDQLNFYGSVTKGFKSGGWNARGTAPELDQPFQPEKVWSYELGMRSEWLDGQLRANVTAFYMDVSDFQVPTAYTPITGQPVFVTKNFADMENKGLEVELTATPIENLTVLLSAGLGDAKYKNLAPEIQAQQQLCLGGVAASCNQGIVTSDGSIADPTRVPDYTITFGGSYVWSMSPTYNLVPSAYLYSVGKHNTATQGGIWKIDGYTTFDAAVELDNTDNNWSLVAECKNCNDRYMLVSGLAGMPYYQEPRTWRIGLKKNFGAR